MRERSHQRRVLETSQKVTVWRQQTQKYLLGEQTTTKTKKPLWERSRQTQGVENSQTVDVWRRTNRKVIV